MAMMIEGCPEWDRCIILFPAGKQTSMRWRGMSAEKVAVTLYHMADEVLRQRVPLKPSGKPN